MTTAPPRLFDRGSWTEASRIAAVLRRETVGGALLLVAAAAALVWANSPWGEAYETVRDTRVGPASLHLEHAGRIGEADRLVVQEGQDEAAHGAHDPPAGGRAATPSLPTGGGPAGRW